jgi:hypothetical protein
MGLDRDCDYSLGLVCHLNDCTELTSHQKHSGFFLAEVAQIFFPIFWWPTAIEIDDMYCLGVAVLAIIVVRRLWGFIWLWGFLCCSSLQKCFTSDLLNFVKCS